MGLKPGDLPTGVLVGTVEIADCTERSGDYQWHLERPKRGGQAYILGRAKVHTGNSGLYGSK
jgi:hypothetical protein